MTKLFTNATQFAINIKRWRIIATRGTFSVDTATTQPVHHCSSRYRRHCCWCCCSTSGRCCWLLLLWMLLSCCARMQIHSLVTDFPVQADVFPRSCCPRNDVLFTEQCPGLVVCNVQRESGTRKREKKRRKGRSGKGIERTRSNILWGAVRLPGCIVMYRDSSVNSGQSTLYTWIN